MVTTEPDRRRSLLTAALGLALLEGDATELALVRAWLGTWSGIGLVAAGMARQDYDLTLTRYDERGWRGTFYVTGEGALANGCDASRWGLYVGEDARFWRSVVNRYLRAAALGLIFADPARRFAQYAFIRWLRARRADTLIRRRCEPDRARTAPPLAPSRLPSRPRRAPSWWSILAFSAWSSRTAFQSVAITLTDIGSPWNAGLRSVGIRHTVNAFDVQPGSVVGPLGAAGDPGVPGRCSGGGAGILSRPSGLRGHPVRRVLPAHRVVARRLMLASGAGRRRARPGSAVRQPSTLTRGARPLGRFKGTRTFKARRLTQPQDSTIR